MIRPERVGVEAHGAAGDNRLPGLVERAVFLGNSYELHVRIVGGDLLKATVPNDGSAFAFEEGAAVTLHLPAGRRPRCCAEAALTCGTPRQRLPGAVPVSRRASAAAAARPVRTAPSMYPATHWSDPQT